MSTKPYKRAAQPEFTSLAIATGMMFLGAFAFFAVMTFSLFGDGDNETLAKKSSASITASPPPPLVFSPVVFASPPAHRNEPPIEPDWEIEKLGNMQSEVFLKFPNSQIPNFNFTPSYARVSLPPPPKTIRTLQALQSNPTFTTVDVSFDRDGFVSSVFIRPNQNLTPEQRRAAINSAYRLHGEPDTVRELRIEN